MDPDQALADFFRAVYAADDAAQGDSNDDEIAALRDAVECAAGLFEWLRTGGYAPNWGKR